jgi:hypothetical protein
MTPERLREIAQIINPKAFSTNYMARESDWHPDDDKFAQSQALAKALAIAPLIEAARAEGQKDMQERSALVADGAINDFNGPERAGMARAIAHRIRALPIDGANQIQSSDGGVEGHAITGRKDPSLQADAQGDAALGAGIKPGPSDDFSGHAPYTPITVRGATSEAKQGAEPVAPPPGWKYEYDKSRRTIIMVPTGADWRTIDSAPKQDRVLLFAPGKNISDDPNEPSVYKVARAADFCWATHWMPLPAAPAQKQEPA